MSNGGNFQMIASDGRLDRMLMEQHEREKNAILAAVLKRIDELKLMQKDDPTQTDEPKQTNLAD